MCLDELLVHLIQQMYTNVTQTSSFPFHLNICATKIYHFVEIDILEYQWLSAMRGLSLKQVFIWDRFYCTCDGL